MEVMFLGCIKPRCEFGICSVMNFILQLNYKGIEMREHFTRYFVYILYSLDIILHRLMKFCNEIVHHVQTSP